MTIASEISNLQTNLANSYDAIEEKGGTLPQAQNFDNLASAINSIVLKREVGEVVKSLLPLNSATYHLLDGALISGNGIYSDFVDYIAGLYGDGTNIPAYFVDETTWQNSVTTYGVCGKFVYDSTNNTVRLPKITGILEGTTDANALGDLVEAGCPNITGEFVFSDNIVKNDNTALYVYDPIGCFYGSSHTGNTCANNNVTVAEVSSINRRLAIDASRSSSIYGNSNTVQPQTIKAYYYIVLASSTKTDIQVDIDNIVTDLNNKVSKTGNETIGGDKTFSDSVNIGTPYTNGPGISLHNNDGGIELFGNSTTGSQGGYIDFHGVSSHDQDYSSRIYEDADYSIKIEPGSNCFCIVPHSNTNTAHIIRSNQIPYIVLEQPGNSWIALVKGINSQALSILDGSLTSYVPIFCGNSYGANSVITNLALNHNATGGTLLGNGIRINWGVTANSSSRGETCTFSIPFETTNYAVAFSQPYAGWSTQAGPSTYNYTTTTFDCIYQGETGYFAHWIAIGH